MAGCRLVLAKVQQIDADVPPARFEVAVRDNASLASCLADSSVNGRTLASFTSTGVVGAIGSNTPGPTGG